MTIEQIHISDAFGQGKGITYTSVGGQKVKVHSVTDLFQYMQMWADGHGRLTVDGEVRTYFFQNRKECTQEMAKHQPFGWVQDKYSDCAFQITVVDNDGICVSDIDEGTVMFEYDTALQQFEFLDGSAFGIVSQE